MSIRLTFSRNRGETAKMFERLQKAASLNPDDGLLREFIDSLRKEAFELAEAGQIDGAAALYRQMIDILPTDAKSHYNLATMLKRRGDLDGAMRHYQEAVRHDPDYVLALFNVAEIYAKGRDRSERPCPSIGELFGSNPDFFPALNNLANLLALHPDPGIRNVPEAIQLAEKGCKLTKYRDPILLDTLGSGLCRLGPLRRGPEDRRTGARTGERRR